MPHAFSPLQERIQCEEIARVSVPDVAERSVLALSRQLLFLCSKLPRILPGIILSQAFRSGRKGSGRLTRTLYLPAETLLFLAGRYRELHSANYTFAMRKTVLGSRIKLGLSNERAWRFHCQSVCHARKTQGQRPMERTSDMPSRSIDDLCKAILVENASEK